MVNRRETVVVSRLFTRLSKVVVCFISTQILHLLFKQLAIVLVIASYKNVYKLTRNGCNIYIYTYVNNLYIDIENFVQEQLSIVRLDFLQWCTFMSGISEIIETITFFIVWTFQLL